jgi:hypothetical protein
MMPAETVRFMSPPFRTARSFHLDGANTSERPLGNPFGAVIAHSRGSRLPDLRSVIATCQSSFDYLPALTLVQVWVLKNRELARTFFEKPASILSLRNRLDSDAGSGRRCSRAGLARRSGREAEPPCSSVRMQVAPARCCGPRGFFGTLQPTAWKPTPPRITRARAGGFRPRDIHFTPTAVRSYAEEFEKGGAYSAFRSVIIRLTIP